MAIAVTASMHCKHALQACTASMHWENEQAHFLKLSMICSSDGPVFWQDSRASSACEEAAGQHMQHGVCME